MNACLCLYVGPVICWRPVQGVPRLSPNWDWLQTPPPPPPPRTDMDLYNPQMKIVPNKCTIYSCSLKSTEPVYCVLPNVSASSPQSLYISASLCRRCGATGPVCGRPSWWVWVWSAPAVSSCCSSIGCLSGASKGTCTHTSLRDAHTLLLRTTVLLSFFFFLTLTS